MGNKYQISDSEWEVMKIIWESSEISAKDIIERLPSKCKWAPKTVKTMLSRLINKGIIDYAKEGRAYLYFPRVSSAETIREENKSFIEKVYDGNFSTMLASFVEQNQFTEEEIKQFKDILENKMGESVEKGDVIAQVGTTGYSTGPHLHLEMRMDKKLVDPTDMIASE